MPTDAPLPRFRFAHDEAWLHEVFDAQVAVRMPRWRFQRRLALGFLALGAPLVVGGALWPSVAAAVIGAVAVASGLLSLRRQWLRRDRWIGDERRSRRFGAVFDVALENGLLVQRVEGQDEVLGIPAGTLERCPGGWFLRYRVAHLGDTPAAPTAEVPDGALYLPHRALQPVMDRTQFEGLLPAGFGRHT